MNIDAERSRMIAQILVRPDPGNPRVTAISYPSKGPGDLFPIQPRFKVLDSYPKAKETIVDALLQETTTAPSPTLLVATRPFGERFALDLARIRQMPEVGYDTTEERFHDADILYDMPNSKAVVVVDSLGGGGSAKTIISRLEADYGIKTPLLLCVMISAMSKSMKEIEAMGTEVRPLTTDEEIMRNLDFLAYGNNKARVGKRRRYLHAHAGQLPG